MMTASIRIVKMMRKYPNKKIDNPDKDAPLPHTVAGGMRIEMVTTTVENATIVEMTVATIVTTPGNEMEILDKLATIEDHVAGSGQRLPTRR